MKKNIIFVLTFAFVLALISGCSSGGSHSGTTPSSTSSALVDAPADDLAIAVASMKEMKWEMPLAINNNHVFLEAFQFWADKINEVTEGKITITLYPGDTLVDAMNIYTAVREGIVAVGDGDPAHNTAEFPLLSGFYLGGLEYKDSVDSSKAINDFVHGGFKEFSQVKAIWAYCMPPSVLLSNRKVETLEDLKNLQVRVTGFSADTIKRLGGTPVGITVGETYDALLKGTVDGGLMNPGTLGAPNLLAEVVDYVTICPGISNLPHIIYINLDVWNSLPPAVQEAIEEISLETVDLIGKIGVDYYNSGLQYGIDNGVEVIKLSSAELQRWFDILDTQHADWIADKSATGLDAQAAYDLLIELVEKYKD